MATASGTIRPFAADDAPRVAEILLYAFQNSTRTPSTAMVNYIRRLYLEIPWADPDIYARVMVLPDGRISGFAGLTPLPLRIGDKRIRVGERKDLAGAMLATGFLDEVRALKARGDLHPDLPSIRSVGYRQAWDYLDGHVSREVMIERAVAATRQLAKRQLTWLRSWPDLQILPADDPQSDKLPGMALKLVAVAAT